MDPTIATNDTQDDLERQMSEFEAEHPNVAEAMRIFGISMASYQGALNALDAPRITIGSSTTRVKGMPTVHG